MNWNYTRITHFLLHSRWHFIRSLLLLSAASAVPFASTRTTPVLDINIDIGLRAIEASTSPHAAMTQLNWTCECIVWRRCVMPLDNFVLAILVTA
jgi:hypothetical protein